MRHGVDLETTPRKRKEKRLEYVVAKRVAELLPSACVDAAMQAQVDAATAAEEQQPLTPATEISESSMRSSAGLAPERTPLKPSGGGGGKRAAPEGGSPALLAFPVFPART